jgi:hypothetical protein
MDKLQFECHFRKIAIEFRFLYFLIPLFFIHYFPVFFWVSFFEFSKNFYLTPKFYDKLPKDLLYHSSNNFLIV